MLMVTPKPKPTESLTGYVIRLTEANAYDTPGRVMCYAGYASAHALSFSFDLGPLASIVGHTAEDWAQVSYGDSNTKKRKSIQFGDHEISRARPFRVVRPKRTAVCPECISEHGYIDRFWDLTLATCCPIHGRKVIRVCPSCEKRISWLRPGLLKCRCGASLEGVVSPVADKDELELVRLLKAKYENPSLRGFRNGPRFPLKLLAPLSLDHFSTLVFVLGQNLRQLSGNEALDDPDVVISAAASALRNWPRGFHETLDRLSKIGSDQGGIRQHVRDVYGVLYRKLSCKKDAGDGSAFVTAELDRFLQQRFARPLLHEFRVDKSKRMRLKSSMSRDWICSRFSISTKKIEGWCRFNSIDHGSVSAEQLYRFVTEVYLISYIKISSERRVSKRKAAAIAGMPVGVLVGLAERGFFEPELHGKKRTSFSMHDIERLADQINSVGLDLPLKAVNNADHVTLATILESTWFSSETVTADFVLDIFDGVVMPVTRLGDATQGIYFERVPIKRYINQKIDNQHSDLISATRAANVIGCRLEAIGALVQQEYLDDFKGSPHKRVSLEQVNAFAEEYVSLGCLAESLKTLPRVLRRQAAEDGSVAISLQCSQGFQVDFIRRSDVAVFTSRFKKNRARERREANARRIKHTPPEKLERYFASLRESGSPLPRTGKHPTLRTIAQKAGLERSIFYINLDARAALARYEKEDAKINGIDSRPDLEILETHLQRVLDKGSFEEIQRYASLDKKALANRLSISRSVFYLNKKAGLVLRRFQKKAKALQQTKPIHARDRFSQ